MFRLPENLAGGSMCADPENHLWWDEIHPTTAGFTYLTADILNTVNTLDVAVPVPAAAWFFIWYSWSYWC